MQRQAGVDAVATVRPRRALPTLLPLLWLLLWPLWLHALAAQASRGNCVADGAAPDGADAAALWGEHDDWCAAPDAATAATATTSCADGARAPAADKCRGAGLHRYWLRRLESLWNGVRGSGASRDRQPVASGADARGVAAGAATVSRSTARIAASHSKPQWCPRSDRHRATPSVNDTQLSALVQRATSDVDPVSSAGGRAMPLLVRFHARYCPFSAESEPVFDAVATRAFPHMCAVSVDVGEYNSVLVKYGLNSVPVLCLMWPQLDGSGDGGRWNLGAATVKLRRYRGARRVAPFRAWVARAANVTAVAEAATSGTVAGTAPAGGDGGALTRSWWRMRMRWQRRAWFSSSLSSLSSPALPMATPADDERADAASAGASAAAASVVVERHPHEHVYVLTATACWLLSALYIIGAAVVRRKQERAA